MQEIVSILKKDILSKDHDKIYDSRTIVQFGNYAWRFMNFVWKFIHNINLIVQFLTASIALAVLGITLMMMMMTRTFFEISLKINKSVKRITLMMMMTQNFFWSRPKNQQKCCKINKNVAISFNQLQFPAFSCNYLQFCTITCNFVQ